MSNTVEVFINGSENVSGAVAKAIAALEALKDQKFDIDIDVDTDKADKAIKGLKDDVDGISKNKVDLNVDTDKARKKITYLQEKKDKLANQTQIGLDAGPANSKLDRLHEKKNKFATDATKIELDAGPANSKLDRLLDKRDKFTSDPVKVELDTDNAKSKLKELADETQSIKLNVDATEAIAQIEAVGASIDKLRDRNIDLGVNSAGAVSELQAIKGLLAEINDKTINVKVKEAADTARAFDRISEKVDKLDTKVITPKIDGKSLEDEEKKLNSKRRAVTATYKVEFVEDEGFITNRLRRNNDIIRSFQEIQAPDNLDTLDRALKKYKSQEIEFKVYSTIDQDDTNNLNYWLESGKRVVQIDFDVLGQPDRLKEVAYDLQRIKEELDFDVDQSSFDSLQKKLNNKEHLQVKLEYVQFGDDKIAEVLSEDNKVIRVTTIGDGNIADFLKDNKLKSKMTIDVDRQEVDGVLTTIAAVGNKRIVVDADVDGIEKVADLALAVGAMDDDKKIKVDVDVDDKGLSELDNKFRNKEKIKIGIEYVQLDNDEVGRVLKEDNRIVKIETVATGSLNDFLRNEKFKKGIDFEINNSMLNGEMAKILSIGDERIKIDASVTGVEDVVAMAVATGALEDKNINVDVDVDENLSDLDKKLNSNKTLRINVEYVQIGDDIAEVIKENNQVISINRVGDGDLQNFLKEKEIKKTLTIDVDRQLLDGELANIANIDGKRILVDADVRGTNDIIDMAVAQGALRDESYSINVEVDDGFNDFQKRLNDNKTIRIGVEYVDLGNNRIGRVLKDGGSVVRIDTVADNKSLPDYLNENNIKRKVSFDVDRQMLDGSIETIASIGDKKIQMDIDVDGVDKAVAAVAAIGALKDKDIKVNVVTDNNSLKNRMNDIFRSNAALAKITKDINNSLNDRFGSQNEIDGLKKIIAAQEKINELKKKVADDDSYDNNLKQLEKLKKQADEISSRPSGDVFGFDEDAEQVKNLEKRIKSIQENGSIDPDREGKLKEAREKVTGLKKDIEKMNEAGDGAVWLEEQRRQIDALQKRINILNKSRENYESRGGNTDPIDRQIDSFEKRIKEIARIKTSPELQIKKDQLKAARDDLEKLERQIINVDVDVDSAELVALKAALKSVNERIEAKLDVDDSELGRIRNEIVRIKAIIDSDNKIGDDINKARSDIDKARSEHTIDVDVDDAAARARLASLSENRRATVTVDVDRSGLSRVTSAISGIRRGLSGLINDNDRNRRGSLFGDLISNSDNAIRSIGRVSQSVNKGIAAVTRGIPVIGGLARAAGGIAGPVGATAAALIGLGAAGVIASGAITAGAYVATAAMGAVAGAVGLVGAAIGGAFIGGFAALVKDVPVVSEAYSKLGESVSASMKQLAMPVAVPLAELAPKLQSAFDQLRPSISRTASQTGELVNQLGNKLAPIAKELGPTMEKAFDAGSTHLNSFMDKMPEITKAVGTFFGFMNTPEVRQAADTAFGQIPKIITKVGSAIEKVSAGYNNMKEFMASDDLAPMREGFDKFGESLSNVDWSVAREGLAGAMNGFGEFIGSIDGQNVANTIGNIASAFGSLAGVASNLHLDDIASGMSKALSVVSGAVNIVSKPIGGIIDAVMAPFDALGSITKVVEPTIEINPNITVKDDDAAKKADDILSRFDGKSAGSADAAERIIQGLQSDLNKTAIAPKFESVLDEGSIAKNINAGNIGKILQSKMKEGSEPLKIPVAAAIALDKTAGEDGLGVEGTLRDQLSRLTGLNSEQLNIEIGVGTTFTMLDTADGSIGDIIKQTLDANGNLSTQIVMRADVAAEIGNVTGLEGDVLGGFITNNLLGGQAITAEMAVMIKANMGLENASMGEFEAALESQLQAQTGQSYDVVINADGTVTFNKIDIPAPDLSNLPAAPELDVPMGINPLIETDDITAAVETIFSGGIPGISPGDPMEVTTPVILKLAVAMGATDGDIEGLIRGLVKDGLPGGESIEISAEIQANLTTQLGLEGKPEAEIQQKIKEFYATLTDIPFEKLDIKFPVQLSADLKTQIGDGLGIDGAALESITNSIESGVPSEISKDVLLRIATKLGLEGAPLGEVEAAIESLVEGYTGKPFDLKIPVNVEAVAEATGLEGGELDAIIDAMQSEVPTEISKEILLKLGIKLGMEGASVGDILGAIEGLLGTIGERKFEIKPPVEVKPEFKLNQGDFTMASFGDLGGGKGIGIPLYFIPPTSVPTITPPSVGIPSYILPPTVGVMPALPSIPWPTVVEPPAVPPVTLPPLRQKLEVEMGPLPKIADTRSVHHVTVSADPLPKYGDTSSNHHVTVTADPLPTFGDTSSTHTIRVAVVGGSAAGPESAKAGLGAGTLGNRLAPLSMGAAGATAPMGAGMSSGGRGVQAIRQTGVDIANNFADGLASGVGAVGKAANELAQAAGQIGPQVDKYLSANSPEYNEAKRIGGEVVSSISQGITNAQGEIGKAMDGVNKFISDPLGEIDKALSANIPGYDVAKQQAQSFAKGVEDTMSGLGEAAKVGSDGFQKIIAEEFVLPPMDQLISKAQEVGDGIGAALMGDPSKLAGTMDGIGQAISSKIGTVTTKVGAVMDQVNQTMRDKVPGFADAQDKAIEFGNGLAAGVENARVQMNQQLSSVGLPTIPTPQMAIDGINTEVTKAKTAIDQGFALLTPPTIPTPQMAAEGLAAGIQKIKTDIDTGLSMLNINAPAPVIPAPDLGPVKQALSNIPGAVETVNKVESDIKVAKQNLDSIPEQVKTENTIEGNIKAVIAQIAGLANMNTQSTHTVNVVQQGAGIPKGAAAPKGSAFGSAMGIGPMGGINGASMGRAMGVSGSVMPRGTAGLGIAVGALAFGGLLLGLGALFAGLFAILGAFSNNLGKLKPGDIDGGSYRPDGVINHYYYQTTQNNHFDGGLIGDPELQGKRVLEVLESTPNGRRFRNQQGAST